MVSLQLRTSGGIWLKCGPAAFHIDPGPGALVKALSSRPRLDPTTLDAVLLSHRHLDHANDLNIIVEAMTAGTTRKRGRVYLPEDALTGEPVLQSYLRETVEEVNILKEGGIYQINGIVFTTPVKHTHSVTTFGFSFQLPGGTVSLITDSLFDERLIEAYRGSRVLIINTVRLKREFYPNLQHLCVPDAEVLIRAIRPETAILTHFGMTVLRGKPWVIAREMTERTGTNIIAARDGMIFGLDEDPALIRPMEF
ncbi:MAG TPA: MBL fold metallo-hydrolase [Atribacteraceae bacterium]|nr:MBL fold metallo-hydrolase [Atribacteraceae bacterium]